MACGPESVALYSSSRGYEDTIRKAYLRVTVLVLDIIHFDCVVVATKEGKKAHDKKSMWALVLVLLAQPSLILMDHGHFLQYNSVSLGFVLWGFHYMSKERSVNCILVSVFFCLALNFKQMALCYAPAVFVYILAWSLLCKPAVEILRTILHAGCNCGCRVRLALVAFYILRTISQGGHLLREETTLCCWPHGSISK
jgi:ALG6, ALG8 glycosyltransferase family